MSDPSGNAICQYYFNDINANKNILNSKTSVYDLSLVNVGTATFPTINPILKSPLKTPSLYQNTASVTDYSYYVNNTNTSIRNSTGSFSVSFWIYVDSTFAITGGTVWCLHNDASDNLITYRQGTNGKPLFSITLGTTSGTQKFYIGGDAYTLNVYNHIVLTCSKSGTTSTIKYHLNGNSVSRGYDRSDYSGLNNTPNIIDNSTDISVTGNIFDGANTILYVLGGPSSKGITFPAHSSSQSNGFNGYLGQLTIYNKALSTEEISYLYSNPFIPLIPPCFLQGSKILHYDSITNTESYVPIETLRKGTLVKTYMSGYKPITHIGYKTLENPADAPDVRDRLYGLSSDPHEPLYLTGRHSVLRNDLSEDDLRIVRKYMGDVYVTENHYRVPIWLDGRAKPYTDNDSVTIWHFALENENIYHNYGVYANGILVESSSIEYMTDHSKMELLHSPYEDPTHPLRGCNGSSPSLLRSALRESSNSLLR